MREVIVKKKFDFFISYVKLSHEGAKMGFPQKQSQSYILRLWILEPPTDLLSEPSLSEAP